MSKELVVSGPFEMPCEQVKKKGVILRHIKRSNINDFWSQEGAALLGSKQGCYIFAMRAGRGFTPWYVGKATKSFKQECFTPHKINKYQDAFRLVHKGTPVLFFISLPAEDKKKKVPAKIVNELEGILIQHATEKNEALTNIQKTGTPLWSVKGIIRSGKGRPTKQILEFRKMMGI